MNISFNFPSSITLANRKQLKKFVTQIFRKENTSGGSLNFIFCSDTYLLDINKTYLQHNYFTDIITFNLSAPGSDSIDGEIYISTDTVRTNARRFDTSVNNELHRVIFHGVLHLCGYADKTKKEQQRMTEKEDYYLSLYFNLPAKALLPSS